MHPVFSFPLQIWKNQLNLDECGSIGIRLSNDASDVSGILTYNSTSVYIPATGLIHPLLETSTAPIIWSGLHREPIILETWTSEYLTTHPRLNLDVTEAFIHTGATLHIRTDAPPSTSSRHFDTLFWESQGLGATHIIFAGQDVIPPLDEDWWFESRLLWAILNLDCYPTVRYSHGHGHQIAHRHLGHSIYYKRPIEALSSKRPIENDSQRWTMTSTPRLPIRCGMTPTSFGSLSHHRHPSRAVRLQTESATGTVDLV